MKKTIFVNTLLIISVVIGTFLIIEYYVEDNLITKTPIKFHFALPSGIAVLAQSSKTDKIPKDYIAITGDSYAQGQGDWLLEIDPNSNDAFNSSHVLNQLTGKDVISFGKGGASNITGWVREPISRYQFIKRNIAPDIQEPDVILAYFYAGNDLINNVEHIYKKFIPEFGKNKLNDDSAWNDFFEKIIYKKKVGPFWGIDSNTGWFMKAVSKALSKEFKSQKIGADIGDIHIKKTGKINTVFIDNKIITIPDGLESPGFELTERGTKLGLMVFKRSLSYLKNRFKNSQIVVVYIPSVIESYENTSDKISVLNVIAHKIESDMTNSDNPIKIHTASELKQKSNEIANRTRKITKSLGIPFIDTRFDIRNASKKQILHGPVDWGHFNRKGYNVLANSIYIQLKKNNILTDQKVKI